jgi:hypothetical protein
MSATRPNLGAVVNAINNPKARIEPYKSYKIIAPLEFSRSLHVREEKTLCYKLLGLSNLTKTSLRRYSTWLL